MKPWRGFILSLLAALAVHAVILLVPRLAKRADDRRVTVEVSLAFLPADQGVEATRSPTVRKGRPGSRAVAATSAMSPTPYAVAPPAALPAANAAAPLAAVPSRRQSPESPDAPPIHQEDPPAAPGPPPPAGASDETAAVGEPGARAEEGVPGGDAGSAASITPPRARAEILPIYPRSARKAGLEGIVRIAAVIDESGKLVSAEVLSSSGNAVLDQAALKEVQRAIFEPARLAGKPVPFRLIIPFRFRLN